MRKKLPLLFGAAFLALGMVACEGPAGPAGQNGAPGEQGEQGVQGPAGAPGQDALNTCSDCHSSDATIIAKEMRYSTSAHGSGTTYTRSESPCNTCHTHNGFVAANAETPDTLDEIENVARINCRTCHQIHNTYTDEDWTLTTTEPVDLYLGGTFDIAELSTSPAIDSAAFMGANLCAHCHQARDPGDLSAATFTITSSHFGSHHGPQANVLSGQGAYDLPGQAMPAQTSLGSHTQFGCVGCHMQPADGVTAGGHTWRIMVDDATVLNQGGCTDCHGANPFGSRGTQVAVQDLLDQVAAELQTAGILDASNAVVAGTYDTDLVKAYLNYYMIESDRSLGVHNPTWVKGVLQNTLNYLQTL